MKDDVKNDGINNMIDISELKNDLPSRFETITKLMDICGKRTNNNDYIIKGIMKMIDETPDVLTIQNEEGKNIGMLAVERGFRDIVEKAVRIRRSSLTQQDKNGNSIGMLAAMNEMGWVALVALVDSVAKQQRNNKGETILDLIEKYCQHTDEKKIKNNKQVKDTEETNKAISDIYDEVFGK